MKGLSRGISFVTVALLIVAGPASATLIAVGDPFDTDSWTQRFEEKGVGTFNHVELQMISLGDSFQSPGISNFTSGSKWIGHIDSPDNVFLWADGPSRTSLQFDVTFPDPKKTNALTFTFAAYYDQTVREYVKANWTPGAWVFTVLDPGDAPTPTPEPISMVMLGCVGAGMFVARKLRGKRAT